MFERFSERARQVVVLAHDEARALRHDYIGTEHLLLGVLREEEGIAARSLEALGVDYDRARSAVVATVGRGKAMRMGQIPFTPRAKSALELSLREAHVLGDSSIGTEHVLLGLVRVKDAVASRALAELGVQPVAVYEEVTRFLGVVEDAGLPFEQEEVENGVPPSPAKEEDGFTTVFALPPPLLVQAALVLSAGLALGVLLGWLVWG